VHDFELKVLKGVKNMANFLSISKLSIIHNAFLKIFAALQSFRKVLNVLNEKNKEKKMVLAQVINKRS